MCTVVSGECDNFSADIVFVMDSSGSIRDNNPKDGSYDNWQLLLEFMVRMVDDLSVATGQVRIGAVKFSTGAESVFHMNQHQDPNSLKAAIRNIKYMGGHTNTAAGISIMHNSEFTPQNGDRAGVQNIAIIVTDGNSTREKENTIKYAEAARNANIQIYTVGITKAIAVKELREMASLPQEKDKNYYMANDFNSLTAVADALVSYACSYRRADGKCRGDHPLMEDNMEAGETFEKFI